MAIHLRLGFQNSIDFGIEVDVQQQSQPEETTDEDLLPTLISIYRSYPSSSVYVQVNWTHSNGQTRRHDVVGNPGPGPRGQRPKGTGSQSR